MMEPEDWGFMPYNTGHTVMCVLCGAHGWGISTHDRDGNKLDLPYIAPNSIWTFGAKWQRQCWAPHIYLCACGKAFTKIQALGAHVAGNRRWGNAGHGSLERVGYPVTLNK